MNQSAFQFPSPLSNEKPKRKRPIRLDKNIRAKILEKLKKDGQILAQQFRLQYKEICAESFRVKNRYGICYSDGQIKIRLQDLRSGKILRYSSLIDTLCHELAHLRYMNHGIRFQNLYQRILEFARKENIYCPHSPLKQSELHF